MTLSQTDRKILAAGPINAHAGYCFASGGIRIANSLEKLHKAGLINVISTHTDSSAPPLGFRKSFYIECRYTQV